MISVITVRNGEGFVIYDDTKELAVITLLNRTSKGARFKVDIGYVHSVAKLDRDGRLKDKINTETTAPQAHNQGEENANFNTDEL